MSVSEGGLLRWSWRWCIWGTRRRWGFQVCLSGTREGNAGLTLLLVLAWRRGLDQRPPESLPTQISLTVIVLFPCNLWKGNQNFTLRDMSYITELLKMKNDWAFCLKVNRRIVWQAVQRFVLGFIGNRQAECIDQGHSHFLAHGKSQTAIPLIEVLRD